MKIIIKKLKETAILILLTLTFVFIFNNLNTINLGTKNGMLLCYQIIIPSLFPFLVLTLIISRSGILESLPFPKKYKQKQILLNIFLLSNLGGYPIGAKLLNDAFINGKITKKDAEKMLLCSINGGPAFTILAVGGGILGSIKLGVLLYISLFLASFTIFILSFNGFEKENNSSKYSEPIIDCFVSSVSDASFSMLNMSGYIIICSAFLGIVTSANILEPLKKFLMLSLEISNAILHTKNIYLLCFALGFSSFSIIFQVFYLTKSFNPKKSVLLFSRVLIGLLSTFYLFLLLKIFSISVKTIGNTASNILLEQNNSLILSFLFVLTCIAFLSSVSNKKYCGKFSADIF